MDTISGETDTARTARVMLKLFNSIEQDLKFTVETQEDYNNNMLPTLDTNLSMITVEDQVEDSMEGWGEGSHPGTQRVSQQLEVPPSSCTPCPPLDPPSGDPGVGPGAQQPGLGPEPSMEGTNPQSSTQEPKNKTIKDWLRNTRKSRHTSWVH